MPRVTGTTGSRDTDLHRSILVNPALKDVSVREYDLLDAPTASTTTEALVARQDEPQQAAPVDIRSR